MIFHASLCGDEVTLEMGVVEDFNFFIAFKALLELTFFRLALLFFGLALLLLELQMGCSLMTFAMAHRS